MEEVDRKKGVCINALKTKPYGNCRVYDINGELLFKCGQKKIDWYLKRGLATVVSQSETSIEIKLNFESAGRGNRGDIFLLSDKKNICVVCGSDHSLSRHHIVPRCYRVYFPIEHKKHNSHDVLPLCLDCHIAYEIDAFALKQSLAEIYDAPMHGENFKEINAINKAYGYARNILLHSDIIPPSRLETMKQHIKDVFDLQDVSHETLVSLIEGELSCAKDINKKPHGQIVIERVDDLDEFVQMWRKHFVDRMKPRFMPNGWSITYKNLSEKKLNQEL